MTAVQSPATRPAGVAVGDDRGRTVEKISVARLTRVELRKLADTRAGFWMLIVIGLAAAGTAAILLAAAPDEEQTFQGFFSFGLVPATVLLPVLGILSMTSEWSQRTALTTFTLTPARGRVVAAKLIAAVLIAVAATAAAALLSAAANLVALGTGGDGSWHLTADQGGRLLLNQVIFVLMGAGFGALLMSPALAIVLFFALPTVWSVLGQMVKRLSEAAGWLDLNITSIPLSEPAMTSGEWARLGVSCAVWVIVPLAAGTVRVLRREVA
ncbi:ABC transporter permease [Actinoplanes sp. NPDC049316]|uniref:ABC transporter permease n=1 Tax=Actinoplanes sp. NPDC049316 TaxID=3154727 RepID=UPI003431BA13